MAYPVVSAPYGLAPRYSLGETPYVGVIREVPILYNYATNIFAGDFVQLARGYIQRQAVTTAGGAAGLIGVFAGCSYTDPVTKQKRFSQYWPANTLAGDAYAYVIDEPAIIYKAVVCTSGVVVASSSLAMVGQNYQMIDNTGNVNTGNSLNACLYSATLVTGTFPIRVVDIVRDTAVPLGTVVLTSGGGTTTLVVPALTFAIPSGTDVSYIAANGQTIGTGSFVTTAAAVGATSVTLNVASITSIPNAAVLVFTQYPEVLVKVNFAISAYQTATAV